MVATFQDAEIYRLLNPGEALIWSGHPRDTLTLDKPEAGFVPIAVLLAGITGLWIYRLDDLDRARTLIPALTFLAVGMAVAAVILVVERTRRRRTRFAVTDRRVLILPGNGEEGVTTFFLTALPDMIVTEQRDRSGSIYFRERADESASLLFRFLNGRSAPSTPGFRNVAHVQEVAAIIRRAQADADERLASRNYGSEFRVVASYDTRR